MRVLALSVILLGNSFTGCANKTVYDGEGQDNMTGKTIEEVLKEHTTEWMSISGVVGTGIGE